jgi:hypothetical protein
VTNSSAIPLDRLGQHLRVGDMVTITQIPSTLVAGLPGEDQKAILECGGKTLRIVGFNNSGEAEIEFVDGANEAHTIWLETQFTERTPSSS